MNFALDNLFEEINLVALNDRLSISFRIDTIGVLFAVLTIVVWITSGIYATDYLKGDKAVKRYTVFYLLLGSVLILMGFASNLFTFYMCYELMTLTSFPLVMHEQSADATSAGIKYLIYSFVGAYLVLMGFFILNPALESLTFSQNPMLYESVVSGNSTRLAVAVFLMVLGFSVKAGMWPMHAWLPTAHPVAPSPASAVLSGMIVKAGVLGILRVIFYVTGAGFVRGTWVQTTWIVLALITVFMGSMQAYREPLLKRRLAYSTVSQVSYILFGLGVLNVSAFEGAMLQFASHAFSKCALFLIAGTLIKKTGFKATKDFAGVGKRYPLLMWCFLLNALSLIGIPPMGGFAAKWYLCVGALDESGLSALSVIGPVILLVSALLTAGYLLPVAMRAFMPGANAVNSFEKCEDISLKMIVPIVILTALSAAVGIVALL